MANGNCLTRISLLGRQERGLREERERVERDRDREMLGLRREGGKLSLRREVGRLGLRGLLLGLRPTLNEGMPTNDKVDDDECRRVSVSGSSWLEHAPLCIFETD